MRAGGSPNGAVRRACGRTAETTGVVVACGDSIEVNFALEETIVGKSQEIVVEALALTSGIIKTGDELQVRGGRASEECYLLSPTTTQSHRLYNFQATPVAEHNTEEYEKIYETVFLEAFGNPLSTFSIDVDAASYANARRFIRGDQLPPKDDVPFSINLEYARCPWNPEHGLVHIGLKGEELSDKERKPSNLVFLLDVSGSMRPANKLPLLRKAFLLLVDQLKDDDMVSIVVYAGAAGLVLPPTPGSKKEKIKEAIGVLEAGGSTAGCAGIKLAYRTAKEYYIRGGNNRVILATDGDFNVGVSSTSELIDLIEEKREEGISLTVL
jgi:hypothetical protein